MNKSFDDVVDDWSLMTLMKESFDDVDIVKSHRSVSLSISWYRL
jgi:hypothetical protein